MNCNHVKSWLIRKHITFKLIDNCSRKPKASEVLTFYLKQACEPPWTSYFVKYKDIVNDQHGMSCFNWQVGQSNYFVLRVGCFPFIKYHCTKAAARDVKLEDRFYKIIKILNLGKRLGNYFFMGM